MASLTTSSARVDTDLLDAAKAAGAASSRSASQQLSHWARLGRQVEGSSGISPKQVARVLAGQEHYDNVGEFEQAAVRLAWEEAVKETVAGLDYAAGFTAAGESWAEADEQGNLVTHDPTAPV